MSVSEIEAFWHMVAHPVGPWPEGVAEVLAEMFDVDASDTIEARIMEGIDLPAEAPR